MSEIIQIEKLSNDKHGGDIVAACKQFGQKKFLDFSISINPWGPPVGFWFYFLMNLTKIKEYPQPYAIDARESLAYFFGAQSDCFVIGNGGAELIRKLPASLPVKRAIVFEPTFSEYEQAFLAVSKPVVKLRLDSNYKISLPSIVEILQPNDMVFICQPNNPSGNLYDEGILIELLKLTKAKGSWLVIDESFLWFCGDIKKISFQRYLRQYQNLMILNSLTKIGAVPGLRLGFLITDSHIAQEIRRNLDPWCVNHLAQKTMKTILQANYLTKTIKRIQEETQWLQKQLAKVPNIKVYPWDANFYLIKVDPIIQHNGVKTKLAKAGILVRDCSNFIGLGPGYFRVAVGSRFNNRRFLHKLRSAVKV